MAAALSLEGRQIDEGLEDRSGLAGGAGGAIERALTVAPAAHEGADFAGRGLDGDDGGLYLTGDLRSRPFDARDPVADGSFRRTLQSHIECRLHLDLARCRELGPPCELGGDEVNEVRRSATEVGRSAGHRLRRGRPKGRGVEQALLAHDSEDLVPSPFCLGTRSGE